MSLIRKGAKYAEFVNFMDSNSKFVYWIFLLNIHPLPSPEKGLIRVRYCTSMPLYVEDKALQEWVLNRSLDLVGNGDYPNTNKGSQDKDFFTTENGERNWTDDEKSAIHKLIREYIRMKLQFKEDNYRSKGYGTSSRFIRQPPTTSVHGKRPY